MGNCWRARRRDSVLMAEDRSPVAIGQNKPLRTVPEEWNTDMPITERQLKLKRDTFWETAPAYEGRCEIWDALKAACEAAEDDDYSLAQAIIDGANITLPTGRLVEAYDELGSRYVIPKYCISRPTNMIRAGGGMMGHEAPQSPSTTVSTTPPPHLSEEEHEEAADSSTRLLQGYTPMSTSLPTSLQSLQRRGRTNSDGSRSRRRSRSKKESGQGEQFSQARVPVVPTGDPINIKIRVSTLSNDIKMTIEAADKVRDIKRRLETEHGIPAQHVTMLYSGRVLRDGVYLKPLDIPKGFIIQAIVT